MRRGAKPTKAKVESKRPQAPKSPKSEDARVRDLEERLVQALKRETEGLKRGAEAQEQQAATAEILRVISRSPTDVQPVFDVIMRSAVRLCDGLFGSVFRFDGELMHLAAHHNYPPTARYALLEMLPMQPRLDSPLTAARAILTRAVVQFEDVEDADTAREYAPHVARAAGFRSGLAVPMLREGNAVGAIFVAREQPGLFSAGRIDLLKTFADQAVIAIENVRLFNETKEALEQQTATSDILRVIASSPTDVQPVFDAVAESAARLCGVPDASIFRRDGNSLRLVAQHGSIPSHTTLPLIRGTSNGRAVLDARTVHIADLQAEKQEFPEGSENARRVGHRTILCVPLMREGLAIGTIQLRRTDVQLFSERQVALLQTFADQAVIAIENVRLFTELQEKNKALTVAHAQVSEALDQQTATAEILRAISQAQTDVQPVFEAIADSAMRLFVAWSAVVLRYDGEFIRLAAARGGWSSEKQLKRLQAPRRPSESRISGPVVLTRTVRQIVDVETDASLVPEIREIAREVGWRSAIYVPMLRGDDALGVIGIHRAQPGAFSSAEIALLQTFADQAVIAIENVRLFKELEARNKDLTEALEQQTATSEILRVISSSPTDVQPVFDTIARNARRLCDADSCSVFTYSGDLIRLEVIDNATVEGADAIRRAYPLPPSRGHATGRAILAARAVHIADVRDDPEYDLHGILGAGLRTIVSVPMLRDESAIGAITLHTWETPRPFSETQIALIQTFADQAVIAIENVRLFTETKEALERETATGEILRVISSSPTGLQPTFDAIATAAMTLCDADNGSVFQFDGDLVHFVAHHGRTPEEVESARGVFPQRPGRHSITGRAILSAAVVHHTDVSQDPEIEDSLRRIFHTVLAVPLVRDGASLGAITVARRVVKPFMDKQIALLQTFADQAVIAIENVRLFTALQEKNRALAEALDQQTATSEILRVISRSPTDVQPVFDALVQSAVHLCHGFFGIVTRYDGHIATMAAHHNIPPDAVELWRRRFVGPPDPASATGQALRSGAVVHRHDAAADDRSAPRGYMARATGYRTLISVPMLRDGQPIGTINVARREVQPFSDTEIALLQTFADQAVIAIENVRLFKELQARTGELTRSVGELRALGDVSQALSSTLDVDVVLNTIVTRANDLIGADGCTIFEYDEVGEQFHLRATRHLEPRLVELARGTPLRKGDQGILGQLPIGRQAVQVSDITVGSYSSPISDALIEAGYRAVVAVPLIREDHLIGALTMNRKTPGDFPAETIELLQTFATQSALAIQNARLFREIEIKSRELEVASQHKSEFLANMSHELRTPLNAVIGFSEVLSERMFGDLNEKQDEYLKDIHASGQHLLSLINDILDLSKIEAGRMELEVTAFDLPMVIDNAMTLVRERAARRSIALHTTVDERLGQIEGDERKIRQVLLNLLSNAIKFTPEGGRIEVGAKPVNGFIEVSVTDTGVGIAPEDQDAVFEEFKQVGTAEKKVEGTGLGLALSRKFIELHGGKMWVKSQVGAGSTFTFAVPVRRGE